MPSIETFTTQDGRRRYRARVRLARWPDESQTFDRRTDALAWAVAREFTLRHQRNMAKDDIPFTALLERYAAHVAMVNKTGDQYARILTNLTPLVEHLSATTATPADFFEVRDTLLARQLKHDTVNKYMNLIKHAAQYAVESGLLETNPLANLKQLPPSPARYRYLSKSEIERLLKYCTDYRLHRLITVALNTGMRKSEMLTLTWRAVNIQRREITLTDTKNKTSRIVPLNAAAYNALTSTPIAGPDRLVFPSKPGSIRSYDHRADWYKTRELAGLTDVHFHDLRHTAASHWSMAGKTPLEVAEILGHKSLKSTQRYSHLNIDHLHAIVNAHPIT